MLRLKALAARAGASNKILITLATVATRDTTEPTARMKWMNAISNLIHALISRAPHLASTRQLAITPARAAEGTAARARVSRSVALSRALTSTSAMATHLYVPPTPRATEALLMVATPAPAILVSVAAHARALRAIPIVTTALISLIAMLMLKALATRVRASKVSVHTRAIAQSRTPEAERLLV